MVLTGHEILAILVGILGGGLGVNLVAQAIKKGAGLKTDSVIHTMVIAVTAVATYAQYVLQLHSKLPPYVLGISGTSIYGFSQIVFKYASYAKTFLGEVRDFEDGKKSAADAEVAAVQPPADAAEPTVPPVADF